MIVRVIKREGDASKPDTVETETSLTIGRSYECEVCKSLSDREVSYVTEYMKKHGSKKTLIRILNGKIFKHYIIPDDPIDDELPF